MAKYEAHITCNKMDISNVKCIGLLHKWSFSAIDGDPLMGSDKPYIYLTAYHTSARTLKALMENVVADLKKVQAVVYRQKIERIVYDTKTNVDELTLA